MRPTVVVNAARAGHWLPGYDTPEHLDGSMPGDFGFDPFGLGRNPAALKWYQQAELQNGRWAMLGTAGVLFPEILSNLGTGGPAAQQAWYDAGAGSYFAPSSTLFAIQLFLFAWVEGRRMQDYNKPGSANQDPIFTNNKLPDGNEPGYPGGIFDPAGFSKGDMASLKLKEIKNARLAMLAYAGFLAQHVVTDTTPIGNLLDHLADPWKNNVITNELARSGGGLSGFSYIN
jgi:light-harvesting complex I chlorophyll a/b binding protein 2/light-harvesting complex I chlorophyll a/b binding protein 4